MGLDIRLPIGLMFVVMGLLLMGFGYLSDPAIYARSLSVNINLIWGFVLLVFGSAFLFLVRRGSKQDLPSGGTRPIEPKHPH
ncbi:MAG: hypothetical protein ACRD2M_10765 [Terriglobales bacterium]